MRRTLLAVLLLLAVAAPAAQANSSQLSIMMDDDNLLYRDDATRDATLRQMKRLGVDEVRATVLWRVVAEHLKKSRRSRAADPHAYPRRNWDRYDGLVRSARRLGIRVYFNVTGPGPRWAHGRPPRSQRQYADTWKPKAKAFGRFVRAVGRRYGGRYTDENGERSKLPAVRTWSIYNEPNQAGWLTPQFKHGVPWSPVMYRSLWLQGRRALDKTGHRGDTVLIGETAPLGNTNGNPASPMYPKTFIREFFCVDSAYHRFRGAAAKRRRCGKLKRLEPFRYAAWAHHPYTKRTPPNRRDPSPDALTIANIGGLPSLLDRIRVRRATAASHSRVALTEFGYETKPPDPFSGISLARQAKYINLGDYLAYKQPRVIANTQFLLRDVAGIGSFPASDKRHWFTYQSGLYTVDGKAKPAAAAYRLPLVVTGHSGRSTRLWGWLRFLPAGARARVTLQFKPAGSRRFESVGRPVRVTNANGFFTARRSGGRGTWRARYVDPDGGAKVVSRAAR